MNPSAQKRVLAIACLVSVSLTLGTMLAGCSRTVVGGFDDSPDKKYRVYGRTFGAYGHAFVDNTAKTARVTIVANDEHETRLFRKEYRVQGSDVGWDTAWDEHNNLTVVIFDYGPRVVFHGEKKDEPPRSIIRVLTYHLDPNTGTFTEQSAK